MLEHNYLEKATVNPLSVVLIAKIVFTVVILAIPLSLFPDRLLKWIGFRVPEPIIFLRLLGIAYTALVVTYFFGLKTVCDGGYPAAVVWTGIVSNGGAFFVLTLFASRGTWTSWGKYARGVMWLSLGATGAITAGLINYGVWSM